MCDRRTPLPPRPYTTSSNAVPTRSTRLHVQVQWASEMQLIWPGTALSYLTYPNLT